ncbi:MAG TPA: hypothetical protein PK509_00005 [Catalimonadaceae bacterium]|nr:hypothetical protein [Catalimonadaceae bacterium]HPI09924.1 hypothetical protein [Catalimonadaceae bacterium]
MIHFISLTVSVLLYGMIILVFKVDRPDLVLHIGIAEKAFATNNYPVHPIFFSLLELISFFTHKYSYLLFAGFVIFSAALYFKILLSLKILEEYFDREISLLLFGAVLVLQAAIPIPFFSENYMINSLSINYFHNGTLNVSIPFALALVLNMMRYFKTGESLYFKWAMLFAVLTCLSKPSFLFCFAPVFPFAVLVKRGFSVQLLKTVQLSTLIVFFIIAQSLYLKANTLVAFQAKFHFLFLFGSPLNHLRVLAEGFTIGWVIMICFYKRIFEDLFLFAAFFFVLLGYFISFSFVDYVDGVISPNFVWQSSIVNYLFVLLAIPFIVPENSFRQLNWKGGLCAFVLLAHGVCGMMYLKNVCLFRIFYLSM